MAGAGGRHHHIPTCLQPAPFPAQVLLIILLLCMPLLQGARLHRCRPLLLPVHAKALQHGTSGVRQRCMQLLPRCGRRWCPCMCCCVPQGPSTTTSCMSPRGPATQDPGGRCQEAGYELDTARGIGHGQHRKAIQAISFWGLTLLNGKTLGRRGMRSALVVWPLCMPPLRMEAQQGLDSLLLQLRILPHAKRRAALHLVLPLPVAVLLLLLPLRAGHQLS